MDTDNIKYFNVTFKRKSYAETSGDIDYNNAIYPVFYAYNKGDVDILDRRVVSDYMDML